jgi:hypothetical protein
VVLFLSQNGFPYVERRALAGAEDKGDISGIPGICIEVKNCATYTFSAWMRETEVERENAKADFGILVVKPKGVGTTRIGDWWASMYFKDFNNLVDKAGAFPGNWHVKSMSGFAINRQIGPTVSAHMKYCKEEEKDGMVWITPIGVRDPQMWYSITTLTTLSGLLVAAGYGKRS